MRKLSPLIVLFVVISIHPETTFAQKATEFYIPVGLSPGLSQHYTWLGTIDAVDVENMTLTVTNETGTRTIILKQETQIWLDKSSLKTKNEPGNFANCQPGLLIEVKYLENEATNEAEWVKIKIVS